MEGVGATGEERRKTSEARGDDDEPRWVWGSASEQPGSIPYHHPLHPPRLPSERRKAVFLISHLWHPAVPPHDANSNVNANTLIKNVWVEDVNVLF